MNAPFNRLTPAQAERLAMLAEECGEVVQVIGKILRHGYESHHPDGVETNREMLRKELGDVMAVLDLMDEDLGVAGVRFEATCATREKKLRWSHHQEVQE